MGHVLAGSVGVSALVLASAELSTGLKLVGAAYLVCSGCAPSWPRGVMP
jgi:threonine/homoserine/homoserine lactone efflux protein